jgi:hypothetical protein
MTRQIFTKVDYALGSLVDAIDLGTIGLPDIQRPFVWKNAKVRNLFDSMYRGFPIGYLLLWESGSSQGARTIGAGTKQLTPNLLIVDGQQRLTSIYAIVKGIPVKRENYEDEVIEIAFNPLEQKFEVADAAIRRDKAYIPNISAIWSKDISLFDFVDRYLTSLGSSRNISTEDKRRAQEAIGSLHGVLHFPFTALQLAATVSEEDVSEVFVRINSEGKKLNQSDFILTLMSVFWDEGRAELENFCRNARRPNVSTPSPFNHFIRPDPDQLLRVSVGLGFRRARLSHVYSILRGKDLETGQLSPTRRESQFEVLKKAQARVLNLQYWHDFLKCLLLAGYRSESMVSSQNALLFSYTLYLLGRTEFGIEEHVLRRVIAQWFFMAALTGRYSSSPESKMEFDLAELRALSGGADFVARLRQIGDAVLTPDFWSITLPNELATSAARSPSMFAYFAALNLLQAQALYSDHSVSDLLDPAIQAQRVAVERHHLFPKKYLASIGIDGTREVNQIANFTLVEWGDNAGILDQPPMQYVPRLSARFTPQDLGRMHYWHALPGGWEAMEYGLFLQRRRELMARVIFDAFSKLSAGPSPSKPDDAALLRASELVLQGEGGDIEFKSTLRISLHTGNSDPRIELAVLKTIAGFVNSNGGTLIIGVGDDGTAVGIEADKFPNEDRMNLHLVNLVRDRIGPQHMMYIHPRFGDYDGTRVLIVECQKGNDPIYVKDGGIEHFYIRTGAATTELSASQIQQFVRRRFG